MAYTGNKNIYSEEKVSIRFTFSFLQNFTVYIFDKRTTRRNRKNLFTLLEKIDEVVYENEQKEFFYFVFLKEALKLILEKRITDSQEIYEFIMENTPESILPSAIVDGIFDHLDNTVFDENFLVTLTEFIEDKLNYSVMLPNLPIIEQYIKNLQTGDQKISDYVNQFDEVISTLFHQIKSIKTEKSATITKFCTNDENAEEVIEEILNKLKNPANKLVTPWQGLNEMLGGGLENGRCYLFFGLPKMFKSGTLLNIALGICGCNDGKKLLKDPSKKPIVCYFTQENSVHETVQRALSFCGVENYENLTPKDTLTLFSNIIQKATGIGFEIIYKSNKEVNTSYLYSLMDSAKEDGNEIVAMFQDYTKRIRSMANYPDIRLELGEVVNDFTVFAKEENIPLISAAQLNREAYRIMEFIVSKNGTDIGKELNASHIGESALLLENTDVGIIVNRETFFPDLNDRNFYQDYLSFKLIAFRGKRDIELDYFAQPFLDNGFRVQEDIDLDEPLYLERIGSKLENSESPEVIQNRIASINERMGNRSVSQSNNKLPRPNANGLDFNTPQDDKELMIGDLLAVLE